MSSRECEKESKKAGASKQEPFLQFPHTLRKIGPNQIRQALVFLPSVVRFSLSGFLLAIYILEWKTVLQYMPYYGGKYPKEVGKTAGN